MRAEGACRAASWGSGGLCGRVVSLPEQRDRRGKGALEDAHPLLEPLRGRQVAGLRTEQRVAQVALFAREQRVQPLHHRILGALAQLLDDEAQIRLELLVALLQQGG